MSSRFLIMGNLFMISLLLLGGALVYGGFHIVAPHLIASIVLSVIWIIVACKEKNSPIKNKSNNEY